MKMGNQMVYVSTLIYAVILLPSCLSQGNLPSKYVVIDTASCIEYQTFAQGDNIVTLNLGDTTICTAVVQSGNNVYVIPDSHKNRMNCTVDRQTNNVKFCFNTVTKSDAGVYTILKTGFGGQNISGVVYIMDKPTLPTISPTSAMELQQVALTCSSTSTSAPSPTGQAMLYTWTVDGAAPVDQRYTVSTNTLTINTVQRGDKDRVFQCRAREDNGLYSDRTDVSLRVSYRPVVSTSSNVTIREGNIGQISCNVIDANPSDILRYKWYKDSDPTSILTTSRALTLTSVSKRDYGVYSCKAENSVGESLSPASATVIIQFSSGSVNFSGTTTLNEGSTLTLTCNAAVSNPQSSLTWYKNGVMLTVSSQVTTTDGIYGGKTTQQVYSTTARKADHMSNITCVATNSAGSTSGSVILNVSYKPVVEIQPSRLVVIEGTNNSIIKCVVTDANPSPNSFSWRKGGSNIISGDQNYTIQIVRRSDAGSYSCTSTNVAGTSNQATVTLDVQYPPEIADIRNKSPEEGSTLTVTCTTTSSNPTPDYFYWTRFKDSKFRQNSSVLSISNISRTYTDNYTCHAENTMSPTTGSSVVGKDHKQALIDVLYGPGTSVQFNPASSIIPMEENNNRSLPTVRCSADCNPPCRYSWSGSTVSNDATLNLGIAVRERNGTYTCRARNTIGGNMRESHKELNVLIFYRANITSVTVQGGSTHNEHSNVSLVCSVDSYPHSNVTWSSTGDRPPLTLPANPNSTLLLRNVSCYDTAYYTCSAYNGYGTTSIQTKTLYVRCSPRLPTSEKEVVDIGLGDGENLTISSVYVAYPEPIITWYFRAISQNTSNMISQPQVEQIGLNIFRSNFSKEVKDNEFGEYKSVANNNAGSHKAQQLFKVDANRKPSVVTNVSAECLTSSTANISWTPGFDGGLPQWFNIMYRPFTTDTFTSSSSNISNSGHGQRKFYIIFQLEASTRYFFKVKSSNSLGNILSSDFDDCKTGVAEQEGSSNAALVGGVAGTSAAIILIIVIIVGVFLFRQMQNKKRGDEKELSERPLAAMNEIPDGIKDNILYESAGNDFSQPRQDVYAEVVKSKKKGAAIKTNDVYAEVQKPQKTSNKKKQKGYDNKLMTDVYENVSDIKGAANNQGDKSSNQQPAERGYRNEDGLLYVDVAIKPSADGRKNVIIGEEERTDYASVDFVVPP